MQKSGIFVSELSTTTHLFHNYHFCRGNSNKRKSRLGVILKGSGTYIYLNKKLCVREGDVVFIPENIYCYSEWHGEPEIEVVYVSCFIHYDGFQYEPQIIECNEAEKNDILQICQLLSDESGDELESYSLFYRLLKQILPKMATSKIAFDKTLQTAIEYLTNHWNENFSVAKLSKHCCVSESTLYHLFQRELGQTPIRFLNSIKINIAIDYLENTSYSIATISGLVGFHSENHFRRVFADFVGTTPLKYRKNK
ncbi:MAG: helix-turn-helix transcriptional regulator [Clostridia bacterium]|nr:helix-turn-helix transcriptional regulator [Clostridia bacterium]